MGWRISLT